MSDKNRPLTGRAGHHARKNPGEVIDQEQHPDAEIMSPLLNNVALRKISAQREAEYGGELPPEDEARDIREYDDVNMEEAPELGEFGAGYAIEGDEFEAEFEKAQKKSYADNRQEIERDKRSKKEDEAIQGRVDKAVEEALKQGEENDDA